MRTCACAEDVDALHHELHVLRAELESTHHDAWFSFFLAQQHIESEYFTINEGAHGIA